MAVGNAISYMRAPRLQRVLISTLIRPCLAKGEGYMCMLLSLKGTCVHCRALSSLRLSFIVYENGWIQRPRARSVHLEQQPTSGSAITLGHHYSVTGKRSFGIGDGNLRMSRRMRTQKRKKNLLITSVLYVWPS